MNIKRKIISSLVILVFIILQFNISYASTISSDINSIDDNKYPGIKSQIKALQSAHPSWEFKVEYTGTNFNDVIASEFSGHGASPKNLVPANSSSYSGNWICPICGKKVYDSGNWYCASEQAIRYMMDPRNSINSSDVFQFLDLGYTDNSVVAYGVTRINNGKLEVTPDVNYDTIKSKYANSVIKNKANQVVTSGYISTGLTITINNTTYTIIKKGDVNRDGVVDIIDVVSILNYIKGNITFDAEQKAAATIGSNDVSITDIVNVLNDITGNKKIKLIDANDKSLASGVIKFADKMSYFDDDCIQAVLEASNKYVVNPLYLMARIYQEQGVAGSSPRVTGAGVNGQYIGYYNLFNIKASGNGIEQININSLKYAQQQGWNTKGKSIIGGTEFISRDYISRKQNTLYYQKFNVVGTNLYNHQYMQNIMAAQNEGTKLKSAYQELDSGLNNKYVFTIPVYENMPKEISQRPATN